MVKKVLTIEEWIKEKPSSFRTVVITHHCLGFRVSLQEDLSDITTTVGDTIEDAFRVCLNRYKEHRKHVMKEKADFLEKDGREYIQRGEGQVRRAKLLRKGLNK